MARPLRIVLPDTSHQVLKRGHRRDPVRLRGAERGGRGAGFAVLRTNVSRHLMRHPDGRRTVVPVHGGETIGPGMLSKILKDAETEAEEFGSGL